MNNGTNQKAHVRRTLEQLLRDLDALKGPQDLQEFRRNAERRIRQSIDEAVGLSEEFLGSKGSLSFYTLKQEVYAWDGSEQKRIKLGPIEYKLLEYLMRNSGRVVSRDELSQGVWGYGDVGYDHAASDENIKWHINDIRKKLGQSARSYIQTIHGGYKCTVPNSGGSINGTTKKHPLSGDLSFNIEGHALYKDGKIVDLTPKEYYVLRILMENPGIVVERSRFAEPLSGIKEWNVKWFICRLRRKIGDDPRNPKYIETVNKSGYKFIDAISA